MRKEAMIFMKLIRMFGRSVRDGFKSVGRNFSLSVASISCITITLLIVAIALVASYNVENMTKLVKEDFTIVTFVKTETTEDQIKELKTSIENYYNLESYTHQTNKDILTAMKGTSVSLASIIDTW